MSSLRVALVSEEFPPFVVGGIGSHCYDLAYSLSRKGVETRVICGSTDKSVKKKELNRFLEVISLPCLDFPPRWFWFQLFNQRELYDLTSDCDVIHGVNPIASALLALRKRHPRKALIVTHHLNELQNLKTYMRMLTWKPVLGDLAINVFSYPLTDALARIWFHSADKIIVPGYSTLEFMKKVYSSKYLGKVSVIYNGIDFEKIKMLTCNEKNLDHRELSITCFGRLVSHKGVLQFLRHSKTIFSDFPEARLRIFGNGPLYSSMMATILREGLSKNVTMMGHVSYEELIKNINRSSVVVLPTFLEIGPFIAALEAMACKKPVALFDMPFNREFIRDAETGLMARTGDMDDLVRKTELLLSDSRLRARIGHSAFEYVKKHHNWDDLADEYIAMYEGALRS
jgi:1,4-alpha-glucan branching enzyme